MLDFLKISTRSSKRGTIEIYPKFIIKKSSDLMIRGGDFYAIWVEDRGLWSTDEYDATQLIDRELDRWAEEHKVNFESNDIHVLHMWDSDTNVISKWHKYCQKDMRDSFHMLDEKLIFSNTETKKEDYASKRLPYPLEEGETPAWDKLMSTLYSPEERKKIEWAIGSIVSGDSKTLQKFLVMYGAAGTGKSTVLNIIQQLFDGYYTVFDAKALGSANNSFALEAFRTNPLVAIQHDGDLSHIEDNTRINSVVSHEMMTVNEKFTKSYSNRFKCFLFMGTNKPVKITDSKSGLMRRLIDVKPTGNKLGPKEYRKAVKDVSFELGAIALHCRDLYLSDPHAYDNYVPLAMMEATNNFYNFVLDCYMDFKRNDGITLQAAWDMYNDYNKRSNVRNPYEQRVFKEELKNYFQDYKARCYMENGTRVRKYYSGFRADRFESSDIPEEEKPDLIVFREGKSLFDQAMENCPAQYASKDETPLKAWDKVSSVLKDLDTTKLHYVRVPENHIVIDFDIPDESGNKSFEKNLEAASKWPRTYAELSKSGAGIHLHYIYTGDVSKLKKEAEKHIEIKVFTGKSSLRRKLSKCNDIPIMTISSGLPLKEEPKIVNRETAMNEKGLVSLIKNCLNKEHHKATKPEVIYIHDTLDEWYKSGRTYDVSDMWQPVRNFAINSTHNRDYCMKLFREMHFMSQDKEQELQTLASDISEEVSKAPVVFYDVEVFPNLFLVNWKFQGEGKPVVRMINPTPEAVEDITKFNLIGFNNRRYDNHILYARAFRHYTNEQLYHLSQKIINNEPNCFFREAYDLSYTDIYDFSSKKQSLKKFEIELGFHHKELGLPWDQPVPEEKWETVAEYCDNDVLATEAVFNARKADWTARQILAKVAGMKVNTPTNTLTTRIIFGSDRNPQTTFNYRDMGDSDAVDILKTKELIEKNCPGEDVGEFTVFDSKGRPIFPGYTFMGGKSDYRGEDPKEGGYVYAEPGMYGNVALLDIASMHPSSMIAEELFGPKYTARFADIKAARLDIKHKDFESAKKRLNGALAEFLTDETQAKDLAQALKIVINSVYGLTAANFDNAFRDKRNRDNLVAKRGALFMINLKHEVQKRGFTVAHIKTDSIKIPDATPDIIDFVMRYGKMYGYDFEHEATYDRMCLVNDAVYIAKYNDGKHEFELPTGEKVETEWTATGTQFQIPYVFKKLFAKLEFKFGDFCETKQVNTALYLDMNENLPEGEHEYRFVGKVGEFCPIQEGKGGGELLRECKDKDGNVKYSAATGTKGFRWLEAETVKVLDRQDDIDISYYDRLADDAVKTISNYGDYEWFVSDRPYIGPSYDTEGRPIYDEDLPF